MQISLHVWPNLAGRNTEQGRRLYQELFRNRIIQDRPRFSNTDGKFCETAIFSGDSHLRGTLQRVRTPKIDKQS